MHNEERKQELKNFLDAMVDSNPEQAQVHFHNYAEAKVKSILNPEVDAPASEEVVEEPVVDAAAEEVVDSEVVDNQE